MDHDTANLIAIACLVVAVIALTARVITKAHRQDVAIIRGRSNRCADCGYDLRASSGTCPECGAKIPVRAQDLIAAGRYLVKKDVECAGCGANLRGTYAGGGCAACGTSVKLAVHCQVARELGVVSQQVDFIDAAYHYAQHHGIESKTRRDFRESCIGVRDYAVQLKGSVPEAKILLNELGIAHTDQIGRVVYALLDFGLFEGDDGGERNHFNGIFTLDELMDAVATPENRDAAVDQIAAKLGVSIEQINFISTAVTTAGRRLAQTSSGWHLHMSTRDACIAVRDYAIDAAGSSAEARTLLTQLGINDSDQIGNVIWALVTSGLLNASEKDHRELFVGLFTLDELMTATDL